MSIAHFHALVLSGLLLLAGCASAHYKISLRAGGEIITASKPKYISKTGYYRYRAINGKDALVRADEVLQIVEQ